MEKRRETIGANRDPSFQPDLRKRDLAGVRVCIGIRLKRRRIICEDQRARSLQQRFKLHPKLLRCLEKDAFDRTTWPPSRLARACEEVTAGEVGERCKLIVGKHVGPVGSGEKER